MNERVVAIRGAITVKSNEREAILDGTRRLLTRMLKDNHLAEENLVSIVFSVTSDLNAAFPAEAARMLGLQHTPLMCFGEIPVPGSLRYCIRVLMHCYSSVQKKSIVHTYLEEAVKLRPDLCRGEEEYESEISPRDTGN